MNYDPQKHHRRSIRLKGYDYSQSGVYFVTVVSRNRELIFGEIVNDAMRLNQYGQYVAEWWTDIPRHFAHVDIDEFIIMPNHIHGIILIADAGDQSVGAGSPRPVPSRPDSGAHRPALGQIVAYFKYQSTKQINATRDMPGAIVWQRNYYEHIVRNETSLDRIRQYVENNPLQWAMDDENPYRFGV